jgi:hypothetical protein
MSLQTELIDMIFTKMTLVYGRDFLGRWEGLNLADVKTDWGHELGGFEPYPEAIAYALKSLTPGKPPTVLEFRAIALKAPLPQWQELPPPTLQGEKLIAQISKIAALKQRAKEVPGAKDWAKRIIQRHQSGDQVRAVALRFAREALRLEAA